MRLRTLCIGLAVLSLTACALAEDERTPIGPGNPSSAYCQQAGFTLSASVNDAGVEAALCNFADGGACEEWAFFRAECGQEASYCSTHGGRVTNVKTATTSAATCSLNGVTCDEGSFAKTGKCTAR